MTKKKCTQKNICKNQPVFAIGTGRCGTHLLTSLMEPIGQVDANHIQDLDGDSFYRYCAWNQLNVDLGGLIEKRKQWVRQSEEKDRIYFESNPYLSFHIEPLHQHLNAKFIFIIRNPEDVIRSHIVKGWYEFDPEIYDINKAVGYQYGMRMNHFFGRIIPKDETFIEWRQLSRVGKLSWMWNTVNLKIYEQLKRLPLDCFFTVKIEELDFLKFLEMLSFMEVYHSVGEKDFLHIKNSRPGKGKSLLTRKWSPTEISEFEEYSKEARSIWAY